MELTREAKALAKSWLEDDDREEYITQLRPNVRRIQIIYRGNANPSQHTTPI